MTFCLKGKYPTVYTGTAEMISQLANYLRRYFDNHLSHYKNMKHFMIPG